MGGRFAAAAAVGLLSWVAAAQYPVTVEFEDAEGDLTEAEREALTLHYVAAAREWASLLEDPRGSLELRFIVNNAFPRFSGRSTTSSFVGVVDGRDIFEQGWAAELRTGVDVNGATHDAEITINVVYLRDELWFDPNPAERTEPVPADRTDAYSVALHELGHVVAYNGFSDGLGELPPTFASSFDRWIVAGFEEEFGPVPPVFTGPVVTRVWGTQPDITIGNQNHWGNGSLFATAGADGVLRMGGRRGVVAEAAVGVARRDGRPVPGVARCAVCGTGGTPCEGAGVRPSPPSADGRTLTQPAEGLLGTLMNGLVFVDGATYEIGPIDRAVLVDVGFAVAGAGCAADFDFNGTVDVGDVLSHVARVESGGSGADTDENGAVDFRDVIAFVALFDAGCP